MATTIGLTIDALDQIDMLDKFEGEMDVESEDYCISIRYSLNGVKITGVQKRYYGDWRRVSEVDQSINIGLFQSTFLQYLRNRKREYNIEMDEYDQRIKREYQEKTINRAGTMAGY